jgi:exonuclease SbcD
MLRVAHTGDLHLTDGPRWSDTYRCLDYLVTDGIEQNVALWLVGGDLCGTQVPHRATVEGERNTLAMLFQRMAEHAPVVLIAGNHDYPRDVLIYGRLRAVHPILVTEEPAVFDVSGARIFALPYPHKRHYLRTEGTIDEQHRGVEGDLRALFAQWHDQVLEARAAGMVTLFLGHVTIGGCAIAGGEVMPPGQEIEVSVGDLLTLGCDYSGGSHVHLCQEMAPGIWYAGSPDRSNFGEEDEKGYLIVDCAPGQPPVVHRRLTPARRFVTVDVEWSSEKGPVWIKAPGPEAFRTAEVRCRVTVPEQDAAAAAEQIAALERLLVETRGAHAVKIERRIVPTARVRSDAITTATTTTQKLEAYWDSLNSAAPAVEQRQRCVGKLGDLEREVAS